MREHPPRHRPPTLGDGCRYAAGSRTHWAPALAGALALAWFLIRVLPRPSRITYPCQRAAMPLATGFVIWLLGTLGLASAVRWASSFRRSPRPVLAVSCLALGAVSLGVLVAAPPRGVAVAVVELPNDPIGTARGIHPGRVIWVHDPGATDWGGPGYGHWWETANTDQAVADRMLSLTLRALSGALTEAEAWDGFFRHFNQAHGKGDVGFIAGETLVIKVNLVGCHFLPGWGGVDPVTYDLVSAQDYMNTSPQMMRALLRQLVYKAGVPPADISIGDPTALFPNQFVDWCRQEFPEVNYLDHSGGTVDHPRTAVQSSTIPVFWSEQPAATQDYVPDSYARASYLINLANLKSHALAGVTLGAKNHYGSLIRYPIQAGYHDLHASLASTVPQSGSYRALVDLMGHAHLGGKTLLHLVDGLYSGVHMVDPYPRRWDLSPFDGDWTNSLFASQDPVALESVCLDLLREENSSTQHARMPGADDHLHEAALADNPPSGTFYDPDHAGDVARLGGLGVHEHWNNSVERQYSRNLGTGDGIELLFLGSSVVSTPSPEAPRRMTITCRPNPFRSLTTLHLELPVARDVTLSIHAVDGRLVRTLVRETLGAGGHAFPWDGRDDRGCALAPGAYFYSVRGNERGHGGKILLVR